MTRCCVCDIEMEHIIGGNKDETDFLSGDLIGVNINFENGPSSNHREIKRMKEVFGKTKFGICFVCWLKSMGVKPKEKDKPKIDLASTIIDLTHKKIDNFKEYEKIATVKAVQIPYQFKVETLEGTMTGNPNDWLAEGVHKERYPIRNEIFKKTYKEHK